MSYTENGSGWYEVENVSQLQCINANGLGGDYVLIGDIDASGTNQWNGGAGFEPIGDKSAPFTGSFDGADNVISNLIIDRPAENYVGLFSRLDQAATVEKVAIDDANITGNGAVGGLVGRNAGTVHNVTVTGNITGTRPGKFTNVGAIVGRHDAGGRLVDVNASGTVTGNERVGGIVGVSRGTLARAHTTVDVTASGNVTGGVVGFAYKSSTINRSNASGTVSGSSSVGGLVGDLQGTVERSTASGDIEATENRVGGLVGLARSESSITRSNASGVVSADDYVGGLVGFADQDSVINSSNASGVVSADDYVGGLVGYTNGTVTASTASGAVSGSFVVGGLVGRLSGTVEDTYAAPTAGIRGDKRVGGLVGYIGKTGQVNRSFATGLVNATGSKSGGITPPSPGNVSDSYWNTETTNQSSSGGDQSSSGGGIPLTTVQMTGNDALDDGNMDALSDSVWATTSNTDSARFYPTLIVNPQTPAPNEPAPNEPLYAGGNGTETTPYEIETWTHLSATRENLGANFTLVRDLNRSTRGYETVVTGANGFEPIGDKSAPFTGSFDGADHVISNLTIDRPAENYVGLFSRLDHAATVEKVVIDDANITGNRKVGGLVGRNAGTVTASTASGAVSGSSSVGGLVGITSGTVNTSYAIGGVTGGQFVGGLIGRLEGTVEDTYAAPTAAIRGDQHVGGLVGFADQDSVINSSNASGVVSADGSVGGLVGGLKGTVTASTASGAVSGSEDVGGLVGETGSSGMINRSSASGNVSASKYVAGGLVGSVDQDSVINSSSASGNVLAREYIAGGLVGLLYGAVERSTASGDIEATESQVGGLVGSTGQYSMITRSNATGTVSGEEKVGGLVGLNKGAVNTSYAIGGVTGVEDVGGLIGRLEGTVEDTYAAPTAAIRGDEPVGGLVGYIADTGQVNRSFATGLVRATGSGSGGITSDSPGAVNDSYWNVETTNQSASDGGISLTTVQMTGDDAFDDGNMDALSDSVWATTSNTDSVRFYPTLIVNPQTPAPNEPLYAGGNGTETTPYKIETWNHLSATRENLGANFTLAADLSQSTRGYETVVTGANGFEPIGDKSAPFTGSFDGAGHVISNLTIDRPTESYVGLFGALGENDLSVEGSATDLTLAAVNITGSQDVGGLAGKANYGSHVSNITATGRVNAIRDVGGSVGYNIGELTNLTTNVTVTATGDYLGGTRAGGLVGWNSGTIDRAIATGAVTGPTEIGGLVGRNTDKITNARATGRVNGDQKVGGLVGSVKSGDVKSGDISNGTATGVVNATGDSVGGLVGTLNGADITESRSTGTVSGTAWVGGLVGVIDDGTVTTAYATGNVTGSDRVGGLIGHSSGSNAFVTQSYATGSVTANDASEGVSGGLVSNASAGVNVTQSYAAGEVRSTAGRAGGLVGVSDGATVDTPTTYWDANRTTQSSSAGGTALSTEAMIGGDALESMSGLNDTVWSTVDDSTAGSSGDGYPVLAALPLDPQILVPTRETSAAASATESDPESGGGENDSNDGSNSSDVSGSTDEGGSTDGGDSNDGGDSSGESDSDDGSNSSDASSSTDGGGSTDGDDSNDGGGSSGENDSNDEGSSTDGGGSTDGGDSTDEGGSNDGGGSSGGGGGSGSGSATSLLAETVHTQTLDHTALNEIAIDFAEPVDGLVQVTVVEAPDRPTIESSATVVGAVSITPPRESTETNATLAFTLNATGLEASEIVPGDIVVYRVDTAGTVHDPITVSVTAETNDTVTVAAETPGFSTFVLATAQLEAETELEASQSESATEMTDESPTKEPHGEPEPTTEDSPATIEADNVAVPGFGPLVALVALVMLALAAVERSRNQP
ncbi:GLUG motif-containing protein [Halorubrum xinjiangense]|uniref:GLUG motif-containing protein n=1 Tax=Halorubrum xinjiangense TaxID=261291 RepID=UPI00165FE125|nr:GLUG motif-containing protein [Halorubrum xinjiangense]